MQNCEVTSQTHQIGASAKPLGPEKSAHLEKIRTILGIWTEPVLVAYGNYTRHPELGPGLVKMLQVCCEAARQITNAVGAAIALGQSHNFIYVARSGKLVSSIGVRVDAESNFLGACVKSGRAFISHSAHTDLRVRSRRPPARRKVVECHSPGYKRSRARTARSILASREQLRYKQSRLAAVSGQVGKGSAFRIPTIEKG